MPEKINREQTKDAKQEKITELSDDQLDEAAGGSTPKGSDLAQTTADEPPPGKVLVI